MSYQVLARKWRPRNFADLVGQEHVGRTLSNALQSGRIHHAYLFTGARGVGKTSTARILAKALNCEEGASPTPCDKCISCKEIAAGKGMDVIEIDGASNTGVDDIRELRENIRYLPSRSHYKIFIIDEVHMLSLSAFNALLKTLEEPPEHAKFIFATTEAHKIPPTILSRCQRFDFRKISLPRVSERLREISDAEGIEISDRSLGLLARWGEGSMRDSLSVFDQVLAFCGMKVDDEEVQSLLGMVDRRLLLDSVEGILKKDGRRCLEAVRRVEEQGFSYRRFCQELVELFRALVLLKVVDDPGEFLDIPPDELKSLDALAKKENLENLQRSVTILMRTEVDLAVSSSPRLNLEMSLVRLCHLPPAKEISALMRQLDEMEHRLDPGKAPLPTSRPPSGPSEGQREAGRTEAKKPQPPPSPTTGREEWQGLVNHVRANRPLIASILEHGRILNFDLPVMEIGFPAGSFHLEQMKDSETMEALQALAGNFFHRVVTLRITAAEKDRKASPSLLEERKTRETDRRKRLREDALAHPLVQKSLEIFGGEVQEVHPIDKGFT